MECELVIESGVDVQAAIDGSEARVVCLGEGVHAGPIRLRRSLELVGKKGAIIDGEERGRAVSVVGDGLEVGLEGLTIRGGAADIGAGLELSGEVAVSLRDVTFSGNVARAKGGAIYASSGKLALERVRFVGNRASMGAAVFAGGLAQVTMASSLFKDQQGEGSLYVHDGAEVELVHVTFGPGTGSASDLVVRGTMSRAPKVTVSDAIYTRGIDARPDDALTSARCAFGPDAAGFAKGRGNVQGALALDAELRPGADSIAKLIAKGGGIALGGAPRDPESADAGAW